jgi:hypothetical protein
MGMMSLKAICNSKEMEPWSVGGTYDRPIARRIIEGAGIPRGTFANYKIGMATVSFNVPDDELKSVMNPQSHAALMEFYEREKSARTLSLRVKRTGKYLLYRTERLVGRKLKEMGVIDNAPSSFDPPHQRIPSHASFLFPWAARLMKDKYIAALKKGG